MSRLPYLRRDQLDDVGRSLWDRLHTTPDLDVRNDDGTGLAGPFNAQMYSPAIGTRLSEVGGALRREMSIDRRLIELAVITGGAGWRSECEWYAHARWASEAGISDEIIDAIGRGDTPVLEDSRDRAVHAVARQLVSKGTLDDRTFE